MSYVAVTGKGRRAAEWATRWLASGLDVVVDDPTVVTAVDALWPAAERLGLFPGADRRRVRVARDVDEVSAAVLVQVTEGSPPPGCTGLIATEETARGCSPIHVVPLVEVAGPQADLLSQHYRRIGMAPRAADAPEHERRQLGPGVVELTDGDADAIIALMRGLRPWGKGAGAAFAAHEAARFSSAAVQPWRPDDTVPAPLSLYATRVEPEWVDYNGHMTEAAYLTAAGWASDALFRYIGDDEAYRAAGHSFYTVETHIHYLLEVDAHEPITFTTQVLGVDAKRMHLFHAMHHSDTGALLCTAEQMLVHVDINAGRSSPIQPHVAAALAAIVSAHATLPTPRQVGSTMRLPASAT